MMLQIEFNRFYDRRKSYAFLYAGGYFKDYAMRQEVVDTAMDLLGDYILQNNGLPTIAYANTMIRNSIKKSSEGRTIEATGQRFKGDKIYQKVTDIKPLKVRIEQIPGKSEQKIMRLYVRGLTQDEIWKKLGISQQYVSNVVSKWTK